MKIVYDVIITGGGIAGSYAARELSKAKLKVLLIDQVSTLGSTAWTPAITLEKFFLPKEGVNSSFNEVIIGTLDKEKKWISKQNIGYVLDYKRIISLILEQAKKNDCTVLTESTVSALIINNDEIIGVNTSKGDFFGKYFIDSSGSAGILVSQVNLRKKIPCPPSVGIEFEIYSEDRNLKKFQKAISVFFDYKLFPCGYGWVSTNGQNKYKIGMCEYLDYSKKNISNLETGLENFIKLIVKENKIKILKKHGGSIYVGPKLKIKSIRHKNLLGIGDTIGAINPLFGEGIRHALYSADFAVKSIINNINKGENLDSYEKMWKKYVGYRWKLTSFVGLALYEKNTKITQNFYDELLKFVQYLNLEESLQIMKEYNIKVLLNKFPKNIKVITAFLKARFLNFD